MHDDVILLLRPESFRVLLSCANRDFCCLTLTGITKFKYERKNEKDSGRSSKMTPSCKWPIAIIRKTYCLMNVIYFLRSIFKNKTSVSIFKPYLCAHPKGGIFAPVLSTILFMIFLIFKIAAESNGVTTLKIKPLPYNLCILFFRN